MAPEIPDFYYETHFRGVDINNEVSEFAIITAYATTGEQWLDERNIEADSELQQRLQEEGYLLGRMTGYSPSTDHKEAGWAAATGFKKACEIGIEFKQDAIYYVRENMLYLSFCDEERRELIEVGSFQPRFTVDSS